MEAHCGTLTLEELEKVQNRAARFVTGNYVFETGSMTGILGHLKWESLKKRRKDSRLIFLYKGLNGKARTPTDDLIPKNRRCRNQHSLAFQIPSASKEAYKKVQVGKDQEKAQSEKDSHSKNRGGKKPNYITIRYLYHETYRKPNEQLLSQ